jgi:hypothetical protein
VNGFHRELPSVRWSSQSIVVSSVVFTENCGQWGGFLRVLRSIRFFSQTIAVSSVIFSEYCGPLSQPLVNWFIPHVRNYVVHAFSQIDRFCCWYKWKCYWSL